MMNSSAMPAVEFGALTSRPYKKTEVEERNEGWARSCSVNQRRPRRRSLRSPRSSLTPISTTDLPEAEITVSARRRPRWSLRACLGRENLQRSCPRLSSRPHWPRPPCSRQLSRTFLPRLQHSKLHLSKLHRSKLHHRRHRRRKLKHRMCSRRKFRPHRRRKFKHRTHRRRNYKNRTHSHGKQQYSKLQHRLLRHLCPSPQHRPPQPELQHR
mmetsp:Transcript_8285/g.19607  ORF Transcript_8285/g.19607 Transcript_8285/m.19607 type:complete len:212 (+) Transcript_8285:286-921(+)